MSQLNTNEYEECERKIQLIFAVQKHLSEKKVCKRGMLRITVAVVNKQKFCVKLMQITYIVSTTICAVAIPASIVYSYNITSIVFVTIIVAIYTYTVIYYSL